MKDCNVKSLYLGGQMDNAILEIDGTFKTYINVLGLGGFKTTIISIVNS